MFENHPIHLSHIFFFFFFNDTATTEIYTLSLHDALPIYPRTARWGRRRRTSGGPRRSASAPPRARDRKSTRLNSSHSQISYAVFCLKKKKKIKKNKDVEVYTIRSVIVVKTTRRSYRDAQV